MDRAGGGERPLRGGGGAAGGSGSQQQGAATVGWWLRSRFSCLEPAVRGEEEAAAEAAPYVGCQAGVQLDTRLTIARGKKMVRALTCVLGWGAM